jgi:tricarballylate dehydrogenase
MGFSAMPNDLSTDVLVIGAGNAAICAALAAQEQGARVLVLEKAPEHMRGGNTYFTGGAIRFAYDDISDIKNLVPDLSKHEECSMEVGSYPASTYFADIMRVTEGLSDQEMAITLVQNSYHTMRWLHSLGIRFIPLWNRQAFKINDKFRFWGGLTLEAVGGGKGLSDQLFAIALEKGVEVLYESEATDLVRSSNGHIAAVRFLDPNGFGSISTKAVVMACGGFEANPEMRVRYLGPGWDLAKVRGVRYNTGDGIRMALGIGAQPFGHWSGCHSVAWDINAPPFGNRTITDLYQKHSYPFGVVVNMEGLRFLDEGADFRNYTYAKYGQEILRQPRQVAFQIFDAKVADLLRDEYRIPQATVTKANSIPELAAAMGVEANGLTDTISKFNLACQPGNYNPTVLDGVCTEGLFPAKSNWALPIDTPPYLGYSVTCGITFTFGGLRINKSAAVLDTSDNPIPGLFAAGEIVGGLFYHNYPGGAGLMAGSVFGRIAGKAAAETTT